MRRIHSKSGFSAATIWEYSNKEWLSIHSSGSHSVIDTHFIPVLPRSSCPLNLLNSRRQNPDLFSQNPLRTPLRPVAWCMLHLSMWRTVPLLQHWDATSSPQGYCENLVKRIQVGSSARYLIQRKGWIGKKITSPVLQPTLAFKKDTQDD